MTVKALPRLANPHMGCADEIRIHLVVMQESSTVSLRDIAVLINTAWHPNIGLSRPHFAGRAGESGA